MRLVGRVGHIYAGWFWGYLGCAPDFVEKSSNGTLID